MVKLSAMYPQGESQFKGDKEKIKAYMEEIKNGLESKELCNEEFLEIGYKNLLDITGNFYPSVPTFIHACMPAPQNWGLPTAQDAFDMAGKLSSSHLKHTLPPLVQMAAKSHWGEIGAGKGYKIFCVRYEDLFYKWVRNQIKLEIMPVPIAAPAKRDKTEAEKQRGSDSIKDLINLVGGDK